MFGFDKAYSLKCLASDKPGRFCQNRLWLTWEFSFTHTLSANTSGPTWPTTPVPPSVTLIHCGNKTGLLGNHRMRLVRGSASPRPQICKGSQCP